MVVESTNRRMSIYFFLCYFEAIAEDATPSTKPKLSYKATKLFFKSPILRYVMREVDMSSWPN